MEERVRAGIVECKQLAIRDDAGKLRAAITTTPDGVVGIALNSPTEAPRMLLTVNEKGEPQSDLYDQDGKVRVGIRVDASGNPTINLLDARGGKRLVLTLLPPREGEGPAVMLTDEKKDIRMAINVPRHGTALIEMYDTNRRRTFAAAALPNGPAALSMYDAHGQVRTEVSIEPTGVGNFILYDSRGKEIYHPDGTA